ncbi:cytochrome o ubiquinol oxidase subunit II [Serratia plymuthica]|jgi:cytochrome o ubiquinol oxidase subunit 2|uniref:Ubiquinol oxidase subunit 2 n=2 Tax=Serratia plymuthica TaxID=82996 RepID=A0A2X4TZJ4_SERPL|nr:MULTISPECIES: cytochrome o ubiquinol oxidase subunit II [Serratia]AEF44154.1 ubiquinol oxidase, subunit II [Serratia plymuthica AS9]AEF49106.1 ubiquinol oxidase, subunit II [Serratia sp. AS12]AEG26814.1 ubiquinol oxidase, subunit II [Serratia sp. AS13]AGO53926.1 ubiquinol oxidase subunit 2 [Serratia plymuthica 4Rx13]AGP43280.1 cytochrome O ubiquinol oxidase [Serratia plymuthica S13]
MRLKKYNKSIGMMSLIASTVMLSGCNMVLMNPKGAIGVEQRTLIITAIALMLIVVIPVIFMAFAFAWKYRASNKDAKYSPNWSHSNKIEAVVWTIPIIIIAILGTITWKTTHELDPFKPIVTDKKPMTIEVVSLDWKWLFIYPEQGIATVNELAFPKDVPVEFKITSNSVMNSFFIPQLGGQIYAMAGMQTKLHLIGNEAGKYDGISSSFSGRGFSGMKFTAIVTPTEGDFDQWVAKVKASSNNLNATSDFNKLAEPSENNPVEYFSSVKPNLFKETIGKFMGDMNMHKGATAHEGMDMSQGMDMSEHAHAGAEE